MDNKLVIEVPFKDGEKEWFLQFVEDAALDMGKYVRKLIMDTCDKRERLERKLDERKATTAKRPGKKQGAA
jgi:hypothetical protein